MHFGVRIGTYIGYSIPLVRQTFQVSLGYMYGKLESLSGTRPPNQNSA
jgi:hypothetical protein